MKRVSVVFTVHKEKGLADASRLLALLERIDPEVIFLECADAGLEDYLNGTTHPLEAAAVARYRAIHSVDLIPVDIPIAAQDYLRNVQELGERIDSPGNDCRRLITWHTNYVRDLGFAYLNSEYCSALKSPCPPFSTPPVNSTRAWLSLSLLTSQPSG